MCSHLGQWQRLQLVSTKRPHSKEIKGTKCGGWVLVHPGSHLNPGFSQIFMKSCRLESGPKVQTIFATYNKRGQKKKTKEHYGILLLLHCCLCSILELVLSGCTYYFKEIQVCCVFKLSTFCQGGGVCVGLIGGDGGGWVHSMMRFSSQEVTHFQE